MSDSSEDAGVIAVLLQRLEKQRLPRALKLKEKVGRGETLDEFDIVFMKEIMGDITETKPLLDRHPEYRTLVSRMLDLYREISVKALENEKAS